MKIILFLCVLSISTWTQAQESALASKNNLKKAELESGMAKKEETYSITIVVKNIRNHEGVIRFKFFDDTTPFPHDNGFRKIVVPKSQVTADSLQVTYDGFVSQPMGIALLDDENNNWKLDFGWFLPKEGHAFSDYYHSAMRRPVYKDFRFFLAGNKRVVMKMKYY